MDDQPTWSNHGVTVPSLGFGTWQLTGDACYRSVRAALDVGYRHLDTAQMYRNEAEVGRALRDSGVDRGGVWITTKVDRPNLRATDVTRTVDESLGRLGVDRVDLLLIHWPSRSIPLEETLGAMREAQEGGKVAHLGVSNFPSALVDQAAGITEILTDQVEYHVLLGQEAVLDACRRHGMFVTAYSPNAKGRALRDDTVREIAEERGATPAQVALAWLLRQDDVVAIPRSSNPDHIASNFGALEVELTDEDVARLDALPKDVRIIDPPDGPAWD